MKTKIDTRFFFRMPNALHQEVKIRAAMRHVSMGHWINQAIMQRLAKEKRYECADMDIKE